MSTPFIETAAHGLGAIRLGRRAVPGQWRLVNALGKFAGWMGGDRAVATPWPGVHFETDLTDRIQRQMWAGMYEPHVTECFDVLMEPGDVYFDVGAHIGYHAVAAANRVGSAGRVFAFEADPVLSQRLKGNLSQFSWAQATHAAVWDHSGTLTFERSPVTEESGWGTLSEVRDIGTGEHVQVRAISIDDWCREKHVTRWDSMKLDAEGSELAVLQGAKDALEQFQPVLMIEINGILLRQAGISSKQVANFLAERNYRLFRLTYRELESWNAVKHCEFSDTLCLPERRAHAALERLRRARFKLGA